MIFNASTRLSNLSQNAAFSLLTAWSLRLAGVPVVHFVCHAGMSHCVLGTNRQDHRKPPPCAACMAQSQRLYAGADVAEFGYTPDQRLAAALQDLNVDQLISFTYPAPTAGPDTTVPLGSIVLPSARWALRRHDLPDEESIRYLLREYILSAYNVSCHFTSLLSSVKPQSVVIFNGIMYPESAARWVARQLEIPSFAHEVGLQRFSVFFTDEEPTAYPIHIPADFKLTAEQDARLDTYLQQRFQGNFTMAGINFWPEMHRLDESFLRKAEGFSQIVPIFTNVIYDTSQVRANQIFPHMFAWLDLLLEVIQEHPQTLFVIRAHPDEMRPGTAKQSQQSVRDWAVLHRIETLPNVVFIDSEEYLSSYELIQHSKFVIVYNSSIGLEAALLGKPVLCGGRARYTQYPTVFFPLSTQDYRTAVGEFLKAEHILVPPEFQANARKFLYYQIYRASLPLEDFLEPGLPVG